MSSIQPFSPTDTLHAMQEEIHAEKNLIDNRMRWYATSQSFLLAAYASSWQRSFLWPEFFHHVMPIAALLLSLVVFGSVYAATWAQDMYLREQLRFIDQLKSHYSFEPVEQLSMHAYESTIVPNRTTRSGKLVGNHVHWLVRMAPLVVPLGFSLLWLYAFLFAPVV